MTKDLGFLELQFPERFISGIRVFFGRDCFWTCDCVCVRFEIESGISGIESEISGDQVLKFGISGVRVRIAGLVAGIGFGIWIELV